MSDINKHATHDNNKYRDFQGPAKKQPSEDDMDRYLTNKASAFRYPKTPDIASVVGSRLAAERVYTGKKKQAVIPPRTRRAGVAVAFTVALVVLAVVAVPSVRAFMGNLSGGIWRIIQNAPQPPNVPVVTTVTPVSPWDPRLVGETDLGSAIATMGGTTMLPTYPTDLGLPDHVYYQRDLNNMIIYVWMEPGHPDTPALALYRFPDTISGTKILASDTQIITQTQKVINNTVVTDMLKVGGNVAKWIKGQYLFELEYVDDNGYMVKHLGELIDGNTLVWGPKDSSYSYKLVTPATTSLDEAIRIAESMQPLSPPPTPYPTTTPTSPSTRLDLTGEVSYDQADEAAGFKIKVPVTTDMPELVAPDKIYVQHGAGTGNIVVTAWFTPGRTDDLRMVMMQGNWDGTLDALDAGVETILQTTSVPGIEAQWVQGPQYMYAGTGQNNSAPVQRSLITNSHILIWQQDGRKYRLETTLELPEALAVAGALK